MRSPNHGHSRMSWFGNYDADMVSMRTPTLLTVIFKKLVSNSNISTKYFTDFFKVIALSNSSDRGTSGTRIKRPTALSTLYFTKATRFIYYEVNVDIIIHFILQFFSYYKASNFEAYYLLLCR